VDYDQLQITNQDFMKQIAEASDNLAARQKVSSSLISNLSTARDDLTTMEKEIQRLRHFAKVQEKAMNKNLSEAESVDRVMRELLMAYEEMTDKNSQYRVRGVSEYIEKSRDLRDIERVVRNWERKVHLADMNAKRLALVLNNLDGQ
jgi:chromosome segregation ATPase